MTLHMAKLKALQYSNRYNTFWYVRKISDNDYQPFAHSSDDDLTVGSYYCGHEKYVLENGVL